MHTILFTNMTLYPGVKRALSDNETVPENILQGYNYYACNHTGGEKKGGVGLFYKESLPILIRDDLSFEECIVAELRFGRKIIFL